MDNSQIPWMCAECGYSASKRFPGDICPKCGVTYWMCAECGFTTVAPAPPEFCPECGSSCNFMNLTCYIPELGTPDIIANQWSYC